MNLLRQWLFDNIGLKLTALLLAIVVYVNVYTDRTANMLVSFPIEYADLPDSLTLSGTAPSVVQAELRGTGKQLIALQLKEPRVRVSLLGVSAGPFRQTLVPSDLPLPNGANITVENLMGPRIVELTIDHRIRRDLPVRVRVSGAPAEGYAYAGGAWTSPERVRITGPEQVLNAMDSLDLAPIKVDGKRDTIRTELTAESLPDWCTVDPPTVKVKLALTRRSK